MLDIFNTPTPQSANYQEFYGGGSTRDWVKPRGASMVRFMLIGAGGGGGNGSTGVGGGGGASGTVTSWIGPAIFVPDSLRITVGKGGTSGVNATASTIIYQAKDGNGYTLLRAGGGDSGSTSVTAGQASGDVANNYFGASGIYTSINGTAGSDGTSSGTPASIAASSTTFLSSGAGGAGSSITGATVTPNYGYPASVATPAGANKGQDGFFITQPILVGRGGAGGGTTTSAGGAGGKGGIGCGGGGSGEDALSGGQGGDGAVFIWSW